MARRGPERGKATSESSHRKDSPMEHARRAIDALHREQENLWQLGFAPALEADFRSASADTAATYIRRTLPWLTLMYGLVLAAFALGNDDPLAARWREQALLPAGLTLAVLWLALPFPAMQRWLAPLMGLAMAGALVLMTRGVFLVDQSPLGRLVSYCVVYVLLTIFALSRLRLRQALAATGLALTAIAISVISESLQPDWLSFVFYFPMTAILCAMVCYMIEYHARAGFIASRVLAVEKTRLEHLQEAGRRDARRQQRLGQYLRLVAGNPTPSEIAHRTLGFLCEHAGAQVGTIYLSRGDRLLRTASCGLDGAGHQDNDLGRGETLIGQAAENRGRLRLVQVPADYCTISSATGSAPPTELLIEPVCQEDHTLAVIELGSLHRFSDEAVDLVDHLAPAMAGALVAALAREALSGVDFDLFERHDRADSFLT